MTLSTALGPPRWALGFVRRHPMMVFGLSLVPALERFTGQLTERGPVLGLAFEVTTLVARLLLVALVVRIAILREPMIGPLQGTAAGSRMQLFTGGTGARSRCRPRCSPGCSYSRTSCRNGSCRHSSRSARSTGPMLLGVKNLTVIPFTMIWLIGSVRQALLAPDPRRPRPLADDSAVVGVVTATGEVRDAVDHARPRRRREPRAALRAGATASGAVGHVLRQQALPDLDHRRELGRHPVLLGDRRRALDLGTGCPPPSRGRGARRAACRASARPVERRWGVPGCGSPPRSNSSLSPVQCLRAHPLGWRSSQHDRVAPVLHSQAPVHEHLHVQSGSAEIRWRKSSASNPSGNCVELADLAGGAIALRNSRHPAGPVLVSTREEVAAFIRSIRSGEFDDLGC